MQFFCLQSTPTFFIMHHPIFILYIAIITYLFPLIIFTPLVFSFSISCSTSISATYSPVSPSFLNSSSSTASQFIDAFLSLPSSWISLLLHTFSHLFFDNLCICCPCYQVTYLGDLLSYQ